MVFYGKRFQNDQKIAQLERNLYRMKSQITERQSNPLKTFKTEINLSLLSSLIYESISSIQYVSGCIASYFGREYLLPLKTTIRPLETEYNKWPFMLTQWKYNQSKEYSITQRWMTTTFIAMAICIRNLHKNPFNLPVAAGKTILSFCGIGFLILPELNTTWIQMIDNLQ